MVLNRRMVELDTQLIDRDSFDVLFSPLESLSDDDIRDILVGSWSEVDEMILLRVLPRILNDFQIITSGTVIELALTDQEISRCTCLSRSPPQTWTRYWNRPNRQPQRPVFSNEAAAVCTRPCTKRNGPFARPH